LQKEPTGKKKKGEEERDLQTYPERFNAHILQAQSWLKMKLANSSIPSSADVPDRLKCLTFEHPDHGDMFYEIFEKDALKLHEFVTKRPYSLLLADIPYGFNHATCLHEDSVAWDASQIESMLQSFKIVTTSRIWRVIILHSFQQAGEVYKALMKECKGGVQTCSW
jgi:hypothetical protein